MARNKYPEVTVEKILEVSKRLFLQRGFDQTTIQDIVDELGGLTKGAIYHHFKSKEDIMCALGDRMFFDNNPFELVKGRDDLNGLQKIREVIFANQDDNERFDIDVQSMPLLKNPRILAAAIESNQRILTPLWLALLQEGIADGSIVTKYPRELAEMLSLVNFWLLPVAYPTTPEEFHHKYQFVMEAFAKMGLPILDFDMVEKAEKYIADNQPS